MESQCLSSFLSRLEAENKGIQHYQCLQGQGCLLWGRDGVPAARGGDGNGKSSPCYSNTTRTELPAVLRVLWACEPLPQPCSPSSSQLGPPHHHQTHGCGTSPAPAWCPQWPRTEQKAKEIKKKPKPKQDRPLMLEQWVSGLELKIEIYGYIVQVRGSRGLYTRDRLCTRSQRAAALPVTRFVKKK